MKELPAAIVLAVVAGGLIVAALSHWRAGAFIIGVGMLVAAGLRLTLRERQAGLLVVRSRGLDAGLLLLLGFGLVALANTIPA